MAKIEWARDMRKFFRTADARAVWKRLEDGADPNARDRNGWTSLHHAARWSGAPEVLNALLDAGADASVRTLDGKLPRDIGGANDAIRGSNAHWRLGAARIEEDRGGEAPKVSLDRIADLERFVRAGDRSAPPHFAGRAGILADIAKVSLDVWRGRSDPSPPYDGIVRVLQGAPGAGKSSTLKHLERRWNAAAAGGGFAPRMLYLRTPQDLEQIQRLAQRLGNLLKPGLGDEVLQRVESGWRHQVGMSGTHAQHSSHRHSDPHPNPLAAVFDSHKGEEWTHPVVLAIDEAQNITGDKCSEHAKALHALIERNYGVPLTIVLAGLGDTVATAETLGISRLASTAIHELGSLTADECAEMIAGWGEHFGLTAGRWQDEMQEIADECDHWPMHVQNALAALAKHLVAAHGDMAAVDFAAVRKRSAILQNRHYNSRMSLEMRGSEDLLAAAMRDLGMHSRRKTFARSLVRHRRPEEGWDLPEGLSANGFFDHLVHRGALQEDRDTLRVDCPIPSFRKFMIALGEASAPERAPPPKREPEASRG